MRKNMITNYIKKTNKARIVKFIYKKNETSKQEIAQSLGLSMPTVLQNVKELLENEIICEIGKYESTGGRKAKAISIIETVRYCIGVDITKNHISFVLLDLRGNIVTKDRKREVYEDSIEYYRNLGENIDKFIYKSNIDNAKIVGVGVSIPGIIDKESSLLIRSHILEVSNISLKKFSQFINYDTCFENDANSAAFAELMLCDKNSIYLSLSNTVGGAIFMDNEIYIGDNFKSAEFGHIIIEPKGEICYCGKQGCVDAYCSARELSKHTDENLDLFFNKVNDSDKECVEVWKKYLDYLSITITNLRMIFDCDIILGGYVGGYLDNYRIELDKSLNKYNNFEVDVTYVKVGRYKKEAAAIGIGMQCIDRFFNNLI